MGNGRYFQISGFVHASIFMALPGKFCMVVEIGLFLGTDPRGGLFPHQKPPRVGSDYKISCFKFQIASYKGFHNHAKFAPVLKVLRTVGIGPTHLKLSSVLFTNWLIRIYCSSSSSFY